MHLKVRQASRYLAKYLGSKTSGACLVFSATRITTSFEVQLLTIPLRQHAWNFGLA
jgi:hypothetical protein